jgi:predicted transcriptional regulator
MAYLSSLADNNMLPADGVRDNIIAQETGLSRSIVADQIWKLLELGMVYHGHDENQ